MMEKGYMMILLITNNILLVNLMFIRFQLFWTINMMHAICLLYMHQFLMTWMTNYLIYVCVWSFSAGDKSCEGKSCVFHFFIFRNDHQCAKSKCVLKYCLPFIQILIAFKYFLISFDFYNIYNNKIIIFCWWILMVRNGSSKEETHDLFVQDHTIS